MNPTVYRTSATYYTERGTQGEHVPLASRFTCPLGVGCGKHTVVSKHGKHMICNKCNIFSSTVSISIVGKSFAALIDNYWSEKWLLCLEGGKRLD